MLQIGDIVKHLENGIYMKIIEDIDDNGRYMAEFPSLREPETVKLQCMIFENQVTKYYDEDDEK
jgi:hypothetical protein